MGFIDTIVMMLWDWITAFWGYFWNFTLWVYGQLVQLDHFLAAVFSAIWTALKVAASGVLRAFNALVHLNFGSIWRAIKRGLDRIYRALLWYQKRIMEPMDRLRRQIMEIYNRFFKPILLFLDKLRVMIRILAIFNRRLAALLDSKLFALEAKLLWPINQALKRINAFTSWTRAVLTAGGLLDRVLLLESLRRDAAMVWEILTNPRAVIYRPVAKPPGRTVHDSVSDFKVFADSGGGPYAADVQRAVQVFREAALGG